MADGGILAMRVGELTDTGLSAHEVYEEHLFRRVDIGSVDEDGKIGVSAVEEVRWSEFELDPWEDASPELIEAVFRVFRDIYSATDVTYHEDGDETWLSIEWYVRVDPTFTVDQALGLILRRTEDRAEGPVGLHNALNGGFMSRNAYDDVRSAVHALELVEG